MATSAFGKAFREARASGDKSFTFNGKKYTTEMAKPKTSTKAELGPEMGSPMSADESKDAASRFGYPKGSERLNSAENKETSDMSMKHGGKVKKMSSGGSASSRADGIATKGKTRGKMC
jgi:hypothetical protein